MTANTIPRVVRDRHKVPWIRGPRITRLEEQSLGYFRLDAENAWKLGTNNVGLFIGGCRPLGGTIEILRKLEQPVECPRWIVVAATKATAADIAHRWFLDGLESQVAELPQVRGNVVLVTPELLKNVDDANRQDIAGIILVDMSCQVHKARDMRNRSFYISNDRPQMIANFRNELLQDEWTPPLILLTQKPAKSIETASVARSYCLDAWWFLDGNVLRCGPIRQSNTNPTLK